MPCRILVVEDEPDIRELIVFTLKNHGYQVIEAACGEEAWTRAANDKPEMLLLDLFLPDMDGLSLCEMFRRLPHTANIPILMLTAWATVQARMLGRDAGADDYMTKPFSPRELAQRVEKLAKSKQPVPA
jgi:two-component system alkaline phosphatase synthesis response regulator PhoP